MARWEQMLTVYITAVERDAVSQATAETKKLRVIMKIVHILLSGPYSDHFSYQENLLSKYHAKSGLETVLIAANWRWSIDGKLEKTETGTYRDENNVKIIRLPVLGRNCNSRIKHLKGLYRTDENPGILFIHDCQSVDLGVLASYLKKHHNVRAYVDNHVDFSNGASNWLSVNVLHKMIWKHYVHRIEPYVRKFYGVLPARVDFLINMYHLPADKCELLVMGADDEEIERARQPELIQSNRERFGIQDDDFLIVTGGKIDAAKTQTLLLMKAVRHIDSPHLKLIVFGSIDKSLQDQVEQLTDHDRIQYIGWAKGNQSYDYFAMADLVCFPGRHSVYWEQVAGLGIPMLCKDWPGTHHVDLGGNVVFLERDEEQLLEEKIREIAENPEKYERMKRAAAEKGMKEFSYKEIARRSAGALRLHE